MNFKNLLSEYGEYSDFSAALKKRELPISVAGLVESAWGQFIYETADEEKANLIITYNDMEAMRMADSLRLFCDRVFVFPSKEYIFFDIDAHDRNSENQRLSTISQIGKGGFFVASLDSLLSYTIPKEMFCEMCFSVEQDKEYDIDSLVERLVKMGYAREDEISGKGQFSLRGGILDVFSPQEENPVRIEFFDIAVDSIREFDLLTQRSIENVDCVDIIPCTELADLDFDGLLSKLSDCKKKLKRKKADMSAVIEGIEADEEGLRENIIPNSVCRYIGLIFDEIPTFIDYFDKDSLVFLAEPKRISERAKTFEWECNERMKDLTEKGAYTKDFGAAWASYEETARKIQETRLVSINVLNHTSINYSYKAIFNFNSRPTVSIHGKFDYLYEELKNGREKNNTVIIIAQSRTHGENIAGALTEKGIPCRYIHDNPEFEKGEVVVVRGEIGKGFEYPDMGLLVIAEQDVLSVAKKTSRREKNKDRLKAYTDITMGDYVVHRAHGIGKYLGIKKINLQGITKDYLHICYRGTDSLYVPVDQLDMLYKYSGNGDKEIKLNKLGGTEWDKAKQRVRTATRDMAKQLAALYAERENSKGFAFSEDSPWQREFEDTFLYTETEDQIRSIEEVKVDMETDKPMDRLLCGDVGYGKTEIALRAAFKAVNDSKQVAYLCPTTILAMQQYETFTKRMQGFPIKIEMLSRFRTQAEQKKIIKKLKTGEIDIIIGTHRLVQKDIVFKDLGFLIIDEEQRFGVAHKERLKELKKNVDVLSMSATPIPRTLHMAMLSIRDMSVLETPPENRYPVTTYVLEHREDIIADAIRKELARGGQVFYLYNRVSGIYRVADWIRKAVPEATVAVGHGKMKEGELEDIMYDMVNGKTDVLVCTTIIETGLDIPNANTIIIENADRMGLSQLYQLRGRVGRSARNAYAYFTYKKEDCLSDVAEKRLAAIREFTEFGSGFKIAMRDLEIRGAGDILGAEQHGHIDTVGYDMYCKILEDSVRELKGLPERQEVSTSIDLNVDAFIPERYIKNIDIRIDSYKRIAAIENEFDASDVMDELIDRFGEPPRSVRNLISIAEIKAMANKIGITEVSQRDKNVNFTFMEGRIESSFVDAILNEFEKSCVMNPRKPIVTLKINKTQELFSNIKFLLQRLNELHKEEK